MASKSSSLVDQALNKEENSHSQSENVNSQDEKNTQDQLAKAQQTCVSLNEELHMLAYAVSHDLEQPLRHIMSFAKLLTRKIEDQENSEIQQLGDFIQKAGVTLDGRINAILSYSRLSQHKVKKEPVQAEVLIQGIYSRYRKETELRNIELRLDPLPTIQTDPALFRLIFTKLLENSLYFTSLEKNPIIQISVIQENGTTAFTIQDNGIGMQGHPFDRMVKLFQQGDYEGLDKAPDSLGAGLAMIKRAVNMLGGTFSFSETSDQKPRFHIHLY